MSNTEKPLSGIRVVELANYVAAPMACRMAADLGAEVIKIEGRGGDTWRLTSMSHTQTDVDENPLFDIFNVGKRSISLNIKTEAGLEILFKLLADADVFITNTRNQSLVKLGLDYPSLKARFPRLIYATLTGYGYEGPDRNAPGFDNITFWSRSGFSADMTIDGPGSYPVNSRMAMGDTLTGTMLFGGVMTALYRRERTGLGDFVTMSLYHAGIWMVGGCLAVAQEPYCHKFPEPRNFGTATNLPYRCSDGEWIRCSVYEFDRYAHTFFTILGVADQVEALGVTDVDTMNAHADELIPMFEKAFAAHPCNYWLDRLSEQDIVCGRVNHFVDVLRDEQAWANRYLQTYHCCNGEERVLPTCPVMLGSQGTPELGQPFLTGQHNRSILSDLGYTDDQINALENSGVLG